MMVLTCEGAVYVPDPNPMVVVARGSVTVRLLPRLCDDIVWDIFTAYDREQCAYPTKMGAHMLDEIRAELARRHMPNEPEPVCSRCLCTWSEHDEIDERCPDDERFRAAA